MTRQHARTSAGLVPPKKHLITYRHNCCTAAALQLCATGVSIGGFDDCKIYDLEDIDEGYRSRNAELLAIPRGAGLWSWKPAVINGALNRACDGDIVFYIDADYKFVKNAQPLWDLLNNNTHDAAMFEMRHKEGDWTRRDTFILMGVDTNEYHDLFQLAGGFQLYRVSANSKAFVQTNMVYCQDVAC